MELIDYVVLLKNIRGVLLFDPNKEPDLDKIKWLKKTHRYRNIGVPEGLWGFDIISEKPFVKLTFPSNKLKRFLEEIEEGIPQYLLEGLALSSCYASPLLILDKELFNHLMPVMVWSLRAQDIDRKEILRHIRISQYSQIDFFSSARDAYDVLKEECSKIEDLCRKRKELATLDGKKRFWRIKEDKHADLVVAYFDLLRITKYLKIKEPMISLALSISCGFRV
jgi:hypothetical protein